VQTREQVHQLVWVGLEWEAVTCVRGTGLALTVVITFLPATLPVDAVALQGPGRTCACRRWMAGEFEGGENHRALWIRHRCLGRLWEEEAALNQ